MQGWGHRSGAQSRVRRTERESEGENRHAQHNELTSLAVGRQLLLSSTGRRMASEDLRNKILITRNQPGLTEKGDGLPVAFGGGAWQS